MEKIISNDGTPTFFSEEAGETYHPMRGIKEEATEKYINALDVQPGKVIFDICFGLGYLTAAALERGPATIYCFENDEQILKKILEIETDFKQYAIIKEFIKVYFAGNSVYEKNGIKLIMVFGDARKTIKEINAKADYVFFAPFSPGRAPHMWTEEFFTHIRMRMHVGAKLATFSYAKLVRENLKNAGFTLLDGPTLGRRSPSVVAVNSL